VWQNAKLERLPALTMGTWLGTIALLVVAPRPANEQGLGETAHFTMKLLNISSLQ